MQAALNLVELTQGESLLIAEAIYTALDEFDAMNEDVTCDHVTTTGIEEQLTTALDIINKARGYDG